jgi:hypothetical protein
VVSKLVVVQQEERKNFQRKSFSEKKSIGRFVVPCRERDPPFIFKFASKDEPALRTKQSQCEARGQSAARGKQPARGQINNRCFQLSHMLSHKVQLTKARDVNEWPQPINLL